MRLPHSYPRRVVLGSALLMAFMTQLACAQEQGPGHDDGWFASQLRRYRSYPHLQQAFHLMQKNRLEEAAQHLEQTISIDPDNRDARRAYLDVLIRQQRYRDAVEQANFYLAHWPRSTRVRMTRAYVLERTGMRAIAVRDYDAVYRNTHARLADRARAASAVAEWALEQNEPRQALPALDLALRFSDTAALHLQRGHALAALGRLPEAGRAYRRALSGARKPDEQLAALHDLADLALGQKDTAGALPYLERASALAPQDAQTSHQLTQAYFALGRYDDAARVAQAQLGRSGAPDDAYLLGTVHTARHAPAEAAAAYAQAARSADPDLRGKALLALGYSDQAAGQSAAARNAFAQAARLPGGRAAARELQAMRSPPAAKNAEPPSQVVQAQLLASEAYAALAADHAALAEDLFKQALALDEHSLWRAQLAEVYRQEGDLTQARDTLAALPQPDISQLRELATISLELGDQRGGLALLGRVARQSNDARDYLRLGRAALRDGQNALALQAYRVSQAKISELAPAEQDALLGELGYAYLRNGQDANALETLDAAYSRVPSFALALELANLEQRQGDVDAARKRLDALDAASLSTQQKQIWYATRANLARRAGEPAASMALLREGVQVAPNASLHYQLGLAALAANDRMLARDQLSQVRRLDPDNWSAALQLGYVCQALHDLACAIDAFEQVAQQHPDVGGLAEALAYAYTEQGDNDRAVSWFKRAIDRIDEQAANRRQQPPPPQQQADHGKPAEPQVSFRKVSYRPAPPPPSTAPDANQAPLQDTQASPQDDSEQASADQAAKREALRQQIATMTRDWQLNAYQSVRNSEDQQGAGRAVGSGALLSQGGLEFQMPVPGLGYQDGKILQLESRLLWSNHPGTLAIDSKTLQGTLGLAYKPFKDQDGYLRLERLVRVGDQSQNNWLLHASWGMSDGWGWNPVKSHWNYSTVYVDAGVLLQHEQTRSLYMEARQGHAFAVAERTVLTPHLVLAGRVQRPDATRVSYIEAGAGLSLKTGFNGSRYVAERSSLELLLQYRKPIATRAGGWALSLAAQF